MPQLESAGSDMRSIRHLLALEAKSASLEVALERLNYQAGMVGIPKPKPLDFPPFPFPPVP
jgi:hypothetical protein